MKPEAAAEMIYHSKNQSLTMRVMLKSRLYAQFWRVEVLESRPHFHVGQIITVNADHLRAAESH